MLKFFRNGTEVKANPLSVGVIIFAGLLALAIIVISFVGLGGLLATL